MTGSDCVESRNGAVDAIKGIAIVSVLLIHSLSQRTLADTFALFHIRQAVPVLVVMMGYVGVITRVRPLGEYLRRRGVRLLVPWAIAWVVAMVIVLLKHNPVWRPTDLLGALPASGPGNYFIAIALQFALALPLLRWLLERGPWVLLGTCLALDLSFELVCAFFSWNNNITKACLLRYLFAAGLGMLLASGFKFWPLLPFSFAYLVAITAGVRFPFLSPGWQSQAFLAAGYSVALVTVGLRFEYPQLLRSFGRASWHIFLVQILWFGQVGPVIARRLALPPAGNLVLGVAVCLSVGLAFASAERWVTARSRKARSV